MTNPSDLIHRYRYTAPYVLGVIYAAYVATVLQMTWVR